MCWRASGVFNKIYGSIRANMAKPLPRRRGQNCRRKRCHFRSPEFGLTIRDKAISFLNSERECILGLLVATNFSETAPKTLTSIPSTNSRLRQDTGVCCGFRQPEIASIFADSVPERIGRKIPANCQLKQKSNSPHYWRNRHADNEASKERNPVKLFTIPFELPKNSREGWKRQSIFDSMGSNSSAPIARLPV